MLLVNYIIRDFDERGKEHFENVIIYTVVFLVIAKCVMRTFLFNLLSINPSEVMLDIDQHNDNECARD